ncbi:GH92 family glycosyl hydrolase [uncultured Dysgonomonas sp.]|nr:GH92 family glycosyl hydrolase [uncultured Dysgonomonas sp.]
MRRILLFLLIMPHLAYAQQINPVDYVNTLVGTMSKMELSAGNTYPAVCMPFAMHNWSAHTGKVGDNFQYAYQNNYLYGIRQTHQASLWIGDYGQFSLMPVSNKQQFVQEKRKSWYSHKTEIAKPHYYSVYLADHQAHVEVTPTERAACFRISYTHPDSAFLVVDAFNKGSYVKILKDDKKIIGYSSTKSGGAPSNFKNYFVMEFDKPLRDGAVWSKDTLYDNKLEIEDNHVGTILHFEMKEGEKLNVKVSSSYISFEQANINLKEIGNAGFDETKEKAYNIWNRELSKVKVSGGTDDQYKTFYSCLYRMLIFPRKFYEIDSEGKVVHYSPYTGKVHEGYMYADNGFWDTFRAQFPFMNLLYPQIVEEVLHSMTNIYQQSGWLPEWISPGHRDCMIGSHSSSIIADAYMKGITNVDIDLLYEAIMKNTRESNEKISSLGRLGAKEYNSMGFIPFDTGINQNVSRTLEYAYNDFCIYELSKMLNKPDEQINIFYNRSFNYRNLFDQETKLMRPKDSQGIFQKNFDPYRWGDHFTEGNSWQYTWFVPHDPIGLSNLMGSNQDFIEKMDSVFSQPQTYDISYYKRGIIHLIREMQNAEMGQYAHLNEPMHHMIYMYNYGAPWKTQYWVRMVMDRLYQATPDGYCGDEDNGQMSAWYVFSALGFYPLCPTANEYVFGSPLFQYSELTLANGNKVVVNAPKNSKQNIYVNSISIDKKEHSKNYISFSSLSKGVVIDFEMSDKENQERGTQPDAYPFSQTKQMKN